MISTALSLCHRHRKREKLFLLVLYSSCFSFFSLLNDASCIRVLVVVIVVVVLVVEVVVVVVAVVVVAVVFVVVVSVVVVETEIPSDDEAKSKKFLENVFVRIRFPSSDSLLLTTSAHFRS